VARRGRPLEGRNRRRGLAAEPAGPIAARAAGEVLTSELPMHVRVSLIDRGLRLNCASVRKAPPRFRPLVSPCPQRGSHLEEPARGREGGAGRRQLSTAPGAGDSSSRLAFLTGSPAFAGVSGAVAAPLTASLGAGAVSATAALGPWASRASEVVVQGVASGALDAFAQRTRALAGVNPTVRIPRCWLQVDLQRALAC
jgi:hypothetical protein